MAYAALTATVMIRIGNATPTDIAEIDLPLRAVVHRDDSFPGQPQAFIEVDWDHMHEGLRRSLHELADALPFPLPPKEADL